MLIFLYLQDFSEYFNNFIDKDIDKMGSWTLEKFRIGRLLSNNQSESFNASVKRLDNEKKLGGQPLDKMVVNLFRLDQFYYRRAMNSLYRAGNHYTLREHLKEKYILTENIILPEVLTLEQLFNSIKQNRTEEQVDPTLMKLNKVIRF